MKGPLGRKAVKGNSRAEVNTWNAYQAVQSATASGFVKSRERDVSAEQTNSIVRIFLIAVGTLGVMCVACLVLERVW